MTQPDTLSDIFIAFPIYVFYRLANRFNCFIACRPIRDMNANAILRTMINNGKNIRIPARAQYRRCHIGTPHNIRNISRDTSIMFHLRSPRAASRGKKTVLTHDTQHTFTRSSNRHCATSPFSKFGEYLAISFAVKRACRNNILDLHQQIFISDFRFRATFGRRHFQSSTTAAIINTGTRNAPRCTNTPDTVFLFRGDRP